MEDDIGLSYLPVNTFHQTGITFKLFLSFSSDEQAAAPTPALLHTGLPHLLASATEQNSCSHLQWSSLKSFHFAYTSHYSLTLTLWAVWSRAPKSHRKGGRKPGLKEMKTRYAIGFGKAMLSLCYSTMLPPLWQKLLDYFIWKTIAYINHCSLFIIIFFSKIFRHPIKNWKQNNVPSLVLKSKRV